MCYSDGLLISDGNTIDYCNRETAIAEFNRSGLDNPGNWNLMWIPDDTSIEVLVVEDLIMKQLVVVRDPADNGVLMTFGPMETVEAITILRQKRSQLRNVNINIEAVNEKEQ